MSLPLISVFSFVQGEGWLFWKVNLLDPLFPFCEVGGPSARREE